MSATDRRLTRLCGVLLVLAGAVGGLLVAVGGIPPQSADGSLLFPVAVAGGVVLLHTVRPRGQ